MRGVDRRRSEYGRSAGTFRCYNCCDTCTSTTAEMTVKLRKKKHPNVHFPVQVPTMSASCNSSRYIPNTGPTHYSVSAGRTTSLVALTSFVSNLFNPGTMPFNPPGNTSTLLGYEIDVSQIPHRVNAGQLTLIAPSASHCVSAIENLAPGARFCGT